MSSQEVDQYLAGVKEPQHSSLQYLRRQLLALLPEGEECISYGMPCIKLKGKAVAGYAAFKNHIGYFPHSGSVVPKLEKELDGRKQTKGGFQLGNDERLDDALVKKLVEIRMQDIRERYPEIEF